MAKKREEVMKKIDDISDYFTGDLDDVINSLMSLKQEWSEKYNRLNIWREEKDYYCETDLVNYNLYGWRHETDKEYNNRLKRESRKKLKAKDKNTAKQEREKEQLKRLIKKYPEEVSK